METESLRSSQSTDQSSVADPLGDAINQMESASADQLLHWWLRPFEMREEQKILATLLTEHVEPVIRAVVYYKLRVGGAGWSRSLEREDLCSEVRVKVLQFLQEAKAAPLPPRIEDFRNYVAVIAHHTCAEFLRKKFPQRHRLKDQLRYLLTRQSGFALWENLRQVWVCGFAVWQHKKEAVVSVAKALETSKEFFAQHGAKTNLIELLTALFQYLNEPIELDTLVSIMAEQSYMQEQVEVPWSETVPEMNPGSASRIALTNVAEQRRYLQQVWWEICKLPLPNRTALLLNLRDADEKGLVALLADLQIASLPEIAQALALTPTHFAQLWQALPLEDTQIAALLGVTRQQVINLRKAARKWLARQLNTPPSTV